MTINDQDALTPISRLYAREEHVLWHDILTGRYNIRTHLFSAMSSLQLILS